MKIIDLIKSEFIKNYTLKKIVLVVLVLIISVIGIVSFEEMRISSNDFSFIESELSYLKEEYKVHKQNPSQNQLKQEWYQFYYEENINMYHLIQSDKKYQNINIDS